MNMKNKQNVSKVQINAFTGQRTHKKLILRTKINHVKMEQIIAGVIKTHSVAPILPIKIGATEINQKKF